MGLRALGNPIASFIDYLAQTGTDASIPYVAPAGLTATGGVISDYVDGSDVYRAHIFTSTSTFDVESIGTFGNTVEFLVVAGGGGGGFTPGATEANRSGGGAGGVRSNHPTISAPLKMPSSCFLQNRPCFLYRGRFVIVIRIAGFARGASLRCR